MPQREQDCRLWSIPIWCLKNRRGTPAGATSTRRRTNTIQTVIDRTEPAPPVKDLAAVALGKLGGLKGGKARAAKLSAEERRAIALKGARAWWANRARTG